MGWNTFPIWRAAHLQYLLNTLKVGALEKVAFSNTENSKTVCYDIDYGWEALSALSQKQKTFSEFFFAFLKSILNFKHFSKKDDPHSWCIWGNPASEKYG